jgi:hypothetical protein
MGRRPIVSPPIEEYVVCMIHSLQIKLFWLEAILRRQTRAAARAAIHEAHDKLLSAKRRERASLLKLLT